MAAPRSLCPPLKRLGAWGSHRLGRLAIRRGADLTPRDAARTREERGSLAGEPTALNDIVSASRQASWLVIGWFTPDYRHWAERLAKSLDRHGAPYHLLAKDGSPDGWLANTRRKPLIAAEALQLYPDKTLVLTDVDAEAQGDISGMVETGADVSAFLKSKLTSKGRAELQLSSRVIVLRPTARAHQLIAEWGEECARVPDKVADEAALGMVLARAEGLAFAPLPERYAARERDAAPGDAVLVHDSARDLTLEAFNLRKLVKRRLAALRARS